MMPYTTISEISRRWGVDRATVRAALQRAAITASEFHTSPRYDWDEILHKIEAWPTASLPQLDLDARLQTADALADHLGVTPQTIRNYGRSGLLHRIEITPRAIRYAMPGTVKAKS